MELPIFETSNPATKRTMLPFHAPSRPRIESEAARKKRKFRARKPDTYHDHERAKARKRMKLRRDKNKAQKLAAHLRSIMTESQRIEVKDRVAGQRDMIVRDWFESKRLVFREYDGIGGRLSGGEAALERLRNFSTKIELHEIELRLAEFEISIIEQMKNSSSTLENNDVGGSKVAHENSTSATDPINNITLAQILGEEYDKVLTDEELDRFMMDLDDNMCTMAVGDVIPKNEGVNVTDVDSASSSHNRAQAANGSEGRGTSTVEEHIHGLLQMAVQDFEVMATGHLGDAEADCFRVDAFAW